MLFLVFYCDVMIVITWAKTHLSFGIKEKWPIVLKVSEDSEHKQNIFKHISQTLALLLQLPAETLPQPEATWQHLTDKF